MRLRRASTSDAPRLAKLNQLLIRDEGHRNCLHVGRTSIANEWVARGRVRSLSL